MVMTVSEDDNLFTRRRWTMRKLRNHRQFRAILKKHFLKYLLIWGLLLVLILPVLFVSHGNIRRSILEQNAIALNQGAVELDAHLNTVISLGKILSGEKCYRNILLTNGELENDQYLDMNALQETMAGLNLSHEYIPMAST